MKPKAQTVKQCTVHTRSTHRFFRNEIDKARTMSLATHNSAFGSMDTESFYFCFIESQRVSSSSTY